MGKRKISIEQEKDIVSLYGKESHWDVSKKYGIGPRHVLTIWAKNRKVSGLEKPLKAKRMSGDQKKKCLEMVEQGLTHEEIAKILQVSIAAISNLRRKNGMPSKDQGRLFKREISEEELEEILLMKREDVPTMKLYGPMDKRDLRRFLQFTDKPITSESCVMWMGSLEDKSRPGGQHGCFSYNGRVIQAASLIFHNIMKSLPSGYGIKSKDALYVLHRCQSQGRCVNPNHLYLGTPLQNTQDSAFHRENPNALVPYNDDEDK